MCAKIKLGRPQEWTEERIKVEADALFEWADSSKATSLELFCRSRPEKYTRSHIYLMVHRSETFRDAFLYAREQIAGNREDAVASGRMHQAVYAKTCTFYDREDSLTNTCLAAHHKDMDRAKRQAVQDDTVDTLKAANDAIQGLEDNDE